MHAIRDIRNDGRLIYYIMAEATKNGYALETNIQCQSVATLNIRGSSISSLCVDGDETCK